MSSDKNPCASCAFRAGCKTHDKELYNRLRSEICALSGVPFYCHTGFDWRSGKLPADRRKLKICQGWLARIQEGEADGRFKDKTERKLIKVCGIQLLTDLEKMVGMPEGSDKSEVYERIAHGFLLLREYAATPEDTFTSILTSHAKQQEAS